jgi:hypothetical protein
MENQTNNNVHTIGNGPLAIIKGFMTYLVMHSLSLVKSGDNVTANFEGELTGLTTGDALTVDLLGDRLMSGYQAVNAATPITASQYALCKGLVSFLSARNFRFEKTSDANWIAQFTGEYPGLTTGAALPVEALSDRIVRGYDQIAANKVVAA